MNMTGKLVTTDEMTEVPSHQHIFLPQSSLATFFPHTSPEHGLGEQRGDQVCDHLRNPTVFKSTSPVETHPEF